MRFLILVLAAGGLFLFFQTNIQPSILTVAQLEPPSGEPAPDPNADLPAQQPLPNPPAVIKAIYATGWSAGSEKKINYLINLIKNTELNAIVIDIKDYSGTLSYRTDLELPKKYGAESAIKILKPNALIKRLHDEGIYIIARQAVFQDPILAKARPEIALKSAVTGKIWQDRKGLMWVDMAAKEAWDYNVAIAKDALARGFDEVNFDYIRFASDGNVDDIQYPVWDKKAERRAVLRDFFQYVRQFLAGAKISADLFGWVTLSIDDGGIGQNIDDAYHYFDAVAPMVYPSHYHRGFQGYQNPALYPYEVVYSSMAEAQKRLAEYQLAAQQSTSTEKYLVKNPALRPWLQDFDLGADYDAAKVRSQIDAVYAAASGTPVGWMLWNPGNNYTSEALIEGR